MSETEGGLATAAGPGADRRPAPDPDAVARAWELLGAGDFEAAEAVVLQIVRETDDGDPAPYGLLGYLYQQWGKHEPAVAACRAAVDRGMSDWSNYLMLGSSLARLGRLEEAHAALTESQRINPERLDAALELLDVTLRLRGLAAARALHAEMRGRIADEALQTRWNELQAAYIPPSVQPLLDDGRIDEAIAELETARRELNTRRVALWLHYLDRYKKWLVFTSRQWDRADPDRKPSITVLLISYNHEKFIAAALDGVLKQKIDARIEIHAVDDASTDGTQAIILDYQRRHPDVIRTFFNPTNVGLLDPPQQKVTHKAFTRLTGDYTCILEGDDYWDSPDKLALQIGFLEKNPIFAVSAHNTVKVYEDGGHAPHRFLHWHGIKPVQTMDDAVLMRMFFHTSSVIYRNLLMCEPPDGFANQWSCDIFNTMAHMQYGELRYFDEDMSVYRAHSGGLYSTMPQLKARIFNLEGLMRYNCWLGHRYLKGFALSLNRLTRLLFKETGDGTLPPLSWRQKLRYRIVCWASGAVYDLLDRFPGLDPAVLIHKEPPKASEPRKAVLAAYEQS